MSTSQPIIHVDNLVVEYGKGKKKHQALHGISFQVHPGECVGFIGANGAGKSTTIKTLMGFLFPVSGTVKLFGANCGSVESRQRIGYLPEVALYYPFMKARELLELYGGLQGMSSASLKKRIPELLELLGLGNKSEILLKNFSKGMQQRLGIAQAIIANPQALILDELSSGLDPVGRFDLRQVIAELKKEGKTIFFSSHELTEVESLCDRVIMIHNGKIVIESPVKELMKPLNQFEVIFTIEDKNKLSSLITEQDLENLEENRYKVVIKDVQLYAEVVSQLSVAGATIQHTESKSKSLENYFIELVQGSS